MPFPERAAPQGMGPYSPEAYIELDVDDLRRRFPEATKDLTDEQLFHAFSNTDDDMEDAEWITHLKQAA